MGYIENESEFRLYMEENGPKGADSRSNYRSWLAFISDSGFSIDTNLKDNETIVTFLKNNEKSRKKYKSKDAYSDFGSALNKYRKFITSNFNILINDLEKIEKEKIPQTEKEELRKARIGQGKYRKDLIELWEKCSVSKFERKEFLIASHILPWCNSTNNQRLDKFNGLLLLPNYDKLFDKGYISFNNDGKIILSTKIDLEEYKFLGISTHDMLFRVHKENIYYLEQHREIHKETLTEK